ncbi:hypothetical protein ACMU_11830 [Actibacterium mucosum KCTC 23349]|uniref:Uncharacterized protein n=1 Tax=Actibacterium mucosum KCTC 23349 TaxID=1454373 RepID=A0A037ZGY5_9RHOB|nr:hypothetical protein [Actibacterium mucosum]KAJ55378.1 hypothetical protein ACMU_11830 [Actibacterium mucosum KCTC 23349]
MGVVEDLADDLAVKVIEASKATDNPKLIDDVAEEILKTSSTTQEAFLSAVRVRLSVERAEKYLAGRMAKEKPQT